MPLAQKVRAGFIVGALGFSGCWEAALDRPIRSEELDAGFYDMNTDMSMSNLALGNCTATTASTARSALIPLMPGTFLMGSPTNESGHLDPDETLHRVTISKAFLIAETEVTQTQYNQTRGTNPSGFAGAENPVESVSWLDAISYSNALSDLEGLERCYQINGQSVTWIKGVACNGYRLPTEAEWEYATRAGTSSPYSSGSDPMLFAWYELNSAGSTHPVKQKIANPWGLYDTSGNVYEWVWDYFQRNLGSAYQTDPIVSQPVDGSSRVVRGAAWDFRVDGMRAAWRSARLPDFNDHNIGFRIARSCRAASNAYAANRSISLNGTSQFASTGNTGINVGLPVTYEAWARSATPGDSGQHIVVSERLTTNAYVPLQIQSQSGVWQCVFANNATQQVNLNTNIAVAANTWTHLAFALSSTSADCYVNGVLAARQSLAVTLPTTVKAGLAIGSGYAGGADDAFFGGLIDEVRVWSSYRSADDINSTMNRSLSGGESGLKAYWKFDGSFLDGTANGFDLTGAGTPTFSTNVPY